MFSEAQKAIVFSPHPDDDVFGMGATMYLMAEHGIDVFSVYVTHGVREGEPQRIKTRKQEAKAACRVIKSTPIFLDIEYSLNSNKKIKQVYKEIAPDIVFLVNKDMHPTHSRIFELILNALKGKQIILYEVWSPLIEPNIVVHFDEKIMEKKREAMKCHKSEIKRKNFVRGFEALNIYRGILLSHEGFIRKKNIEHIGNGRYAEVFERVIA